MRILSFDISSVSTGYSVLDGRELISSGIIKMKQKVVGQKLNYFEDEVDALFNEHKPDKVAIETMFVSKFANVVMSLSMFHSVIHKLTWKHLKAAPTGITVASVRKTIADEYKVKLFATKKEQIILGKDNKELAFDFICSHYKLNWEFKKHNDKSDAICIGLAANIIDNREPK